MVDLVELSERPINQDEIEARIKAMEKQARDEILRTRVLSALSDAFAKVEATDSPVAAMRMPAKNYAVLREYAGNVLDATTDRERMKQGYFATLWGAEVYVSKRAKGVELRAEGCDWGEAPEPGPSYVDPDRTAKPSILAFLHARKNREIDFTFEFPVDIKIS